MHAADAVSVQSGTLTLRNLSFGPGLMVDEVTIDGSDLVVEPAGGAFRSAESRFRAMVTEANLNSIVTGNVPADSAFRNLHITLFSGRAQLKGHFVKSVISLPFTLDAKPLITDGVRVTLDCTATQIGGVGLPGTAVELLEKVLNEKLALDLSASPLKIVLSEVRCEPGRLTFIGSAQLAWPLQASSQPALTPAAASPASGSE